MSPEGNGTPESATTPEATENRKGFFQGLKDMISGKADEAPAAATPTVNPTEALADVQAKNAQEMADRSTARVADLEDKAQSGKVPVVPSAERYATGQTPVVPAEAVPSAPTSGMETQDVPVVPTSAAEPGAPKGPPAQE